ncbi:MAG: tetratricopeptide repeat protein [Saprospiraceae bacterium]|nr:tetratricopeptide repeat protein [Saprospiraceae bacterium]
MAKHNRKQIRKSTKGDTIILPRKWIYLVLVGLCFGLYANTLGHQYALDDAIVITENDLVKKGWGGLIDIFTHDSFYGFFNEEGKDQLVTGGRYRPLTLAMFAMERTILGDQPFWGHLLNILWYSGCVSLLLLVLDLLLYPGFGQYKALLIASGCALLFSIHPVHTEVVANIKGRDEIVALSFSLLSTFAILKSPSSSAGKWTMLAAMSFLLALLAKEIAVSFLAVVPLMLYFFRKETFVGMLRKVTPLFLAFVVYMILRVSVVGLNLSGDAPQELMNNPFLKMEADTYTHMSLIEKAPMIIYGLGKYLQLSFFPFPLTHDYYPRHIPILDWDSPKVLLSLGALSFLLATAFLNLMKSKKSVITFCILFFFTTIFLVSNILFPVGTNLSERFLFMPSAAVCLFIAISLYNLHLRSGRIPPVIILVIFVLGCSYQTIARNTAWKNNYVLFTTDVHTSVGSAKVQNATGGELIAKAQETNDEQTSHELLTRATTHLQQAIKIHPRYKNARLLLGNAYYYQKKYSEAIEEYDLALTLDSGYKDALQNRAVSYRELGRHHGEELGDIDQAVTYFEKAKPYLDEDFELHRLLGVAYGNKGDADRAIMYFLKARELRTNDAWIHYNLGIAYLSKGDTMQANTFLKRAKELNPEVGKQ